MKAGQRLGGAAACLRSACRPHWCRRRLDGGVIEADLARAQAVDLKALGREARRHARPGGRRLAAIMRIFWPFFRRRRSPAPDRHAQIGSYQLSTSSAFSGAGSPSGRRQSGDDRLQHLLTADPGLGRNLDAPSASSPMTSSICCLTRSGSAAGRSTLVQHRNDLVIDVDRLIDVGQRLRLDPLGSRRPPAASPSQAASDRLTS